MLARSAFSRCTLNWKGSLRVVNMRHAIVTANPPRGMITPLVTLVSQRRLRRRACGWAVRGAGGDVGPDQRYPYGWIEGAGLQLHHVPGIAGVVVRNVCRRAVDVRIGRVDGRAIERNSAHVIGSLIRQAYGARSECRGA